MVYFCYTYVNHGTDLEICMKRSNETEAGSAKNGKHEDIKKQISLLERRYPTEQRNNDVKDALFILKKASTGTITQDEKKQYQSLIKKINEASPAQQNDISPSPSSTQSSSRSNSERTTYSRTKRQSSPPLTSSRKEGEFTTALSPPTAGMVR